MIDLKLLEKLCLAPGVSGDEGSIRDIVLPQIKNYADKVEIDNLGNIIAFKKGKKKANQKLMLSAHMDEVGLIATYITDDGYIKFSAVGGIDEKILPGKKVFIGKEKVPGVIGVKPIHLLDQDERLKKIKIDNLYIDIGAKNKEEALKYSVPGDYIFFDSSFK